MHLKLKMDRLTIHKWEKKCLLSQNHYVDKLLSILPGHKLLKLGAGQIETRPVSVSHRFVFRRS